jgi:hypothetical protein
MSTCTTCYGTNTTQPCASVGCLSTNYGKCITYSGSNLFCQRGSIATFTFEGTAVSPTINTTVIASVTGGSGTDATFSVLRTAGQTTYQVTLVNQGSNYEVSDVLTILGTSLGGASPLNDITLTVTTLSAVIANGDNLDTVISNLNNRLCLVASSSPSGLDYTAFNYQCLRMGGNLEGVGTVITTAQGFTEAVASALCSLNTRLKGVELPPIIVDTYFGGSIVSGTSTLTQVLNKYGEAIGDVNDKFTVTTSSPVCGTFTNLTTLTTRPSASASLGTWFDWVSGNICTNFTAVDTHITSELAEHTLVNTFLYGVAQAFPNSGARGTNSVDTACLPGGSATSNLRTAVNLIATELCSLKSTVAAGPTSNYTVSPVSCLNTPFSAGSVFGVQKARAGSTLINVLGTTTLQGHLNQIYSVLSNLNIAFTDQFVVSEGPCGPVIDLVGGSTFTCASLASCNLNAMGDVTYIGAPATNEILVRNSSGQWVNSKLKLIQNTVNGAATSFPAYNSGTNTLDLVLTYPQSTIQLLDVNTTTLSSTGFSVVPSGAGNPLPSLVLDFVTGITTVYKQTSFLLNNASGSAIALTHNMEIPLFTLPNLAFLPDIAPNNGKNILVNLRGIVQVAGTTAFVSTLDFILNINSQSNAGVVTAGNYSAITIFYKGAPVSISNGQYIEFVMGGISWSTV